MKKLHWGIIGCGNVTEKKSGPAFYRLPETELTAVMRRNREKAADYARRHGVGKFYSDAGALIDDPEVEAVYIATPPSSHASLTIRALEKGKPVYVEKPMAASYRECLEMVQVAQRTGTPLYVAYYRRAMDYFRKVKDLLEQGAVGEIRHVKLRLIRSARPEDTRVPMPWRLDVAESGGGYFVDMGAHQIDLFLFLFGKIVSWEAWVANKGGLYEAEDYVEASFRFAAGFTADAVWYFTAPETADGPVNEDGIEVTGSKGSLLFSTFTMEPIRLVTPSREEVFSLAKPEVVEEPMIGEISRAILNGDPFFNRQALEDAVEVTRIMEAILKSYYTGNAGDAGRCCRFGK
ncbi:MAG: Gfo/Idh/MocA family oxidoreductase [Parabacteroides sp.]|nr:Gfo/Idh/MocA family oxidoreductase [Parabacteroides sp.]